jgi:hypothetical protein
MLDGIVLDDDAGTSLGSTLGTCAPPVSVSITGQTDGGLLRADDGEPLKHGQLLVMGGGSFRQRGVRWLEENNQAQLKDSSTATDSILTLRDGGVVSSVPSANLGPTKDRILVQLVRAPSGALVLNAAGFYGQGTLAAATYFKEQIFPMRVSLTTRWYVVEWEDLDMSGGPSGADSYTLIASGP